MRSLKCILIFMVLMGIIPGIKGLKNITFPKNPFKTEDAGASSYRIGDRGARLIQSRPDGGTVNAWGNPFTQSFQGED